MAKEQGEVWWLLPAPCLVSILHSIPVSFSIYFESGQRVFFSGKTRRDKDFLFIYQNKKLILKLKFKVFYPNTYK